MAGIGSKVKDAAMKAAKGASGGKGKKSGGKKKSGGGVEKAAKKFLK